MSEKNNKNKIKLKEEFNIKIKDQIDFFRKFFKLNQKELAGIFGSASCKTIYNSESTLGYIRTVNNEVCNAACTIINVLTDIFDEKTIKKWVKTPNPTLEGKTPQEYIKKSGGIFLIAQFLNILGR